MLRLLAFATFLLLPAGAFAECVCSCVNGQVEALCSSALDLQPICAPRICPLVSPSIEPMPRLMLPPLGTSICQQEQVYDWSTGQYVWQTVCD